jgi:5-methylcytosine-specific restriction endonuclease McrA
MRSLNGLSDRELIRRLQKLVKNEQSLTVEILPHLAEVDRRELYVGHGYSSLSDYCVSHLGYGESSAWRRVCAARVIKAVPEVYHLLKTGQLTFSGVVRFSGALRPENKTELLSRVIGKTQAQIERIAAEYKPPKRIPDQARPALVIKAAGREEPAGASAAPEGAGAPPSAEMGEIPLRCEGKNNPIREVLPAVEMERMRWMKTYLSGRYPKGASHLEMIKYAMSYVREREDLEKRAGRRKQKETKQKQIVKTMSTAPESRHIPAREKEAVWIRDQGRCTYVGTNGRRCNSTHNLQFDHFPVPFARGGPSVARNLRLLCAKHNRLTAEKIFGKRDYGKQPAVST